MHLGIPEIVLILIVILLFVGPKKLPAAGAALGKAMRSFRRALSGEPEENDGETSESDAADGERKPEDDGSGGA